jgi:hypothetical protein
MFIPDPDFYPSRIPDPKTATKEKGEKFLLSFLFLQPQISHISEKRTRKIVNKNHTDGAHSREPGSCFTVIKIFHNQVTNNAEALPINSEVIEYCLCIGQHYPPNTLLIQEEKYKQRYLPDT